MTTETTHIAHSVAIHRVRNLIVFRPGDYNVGALHTLLDQVIAWSTAPAPLRQTAVAA
jgi:hypothetical protein